MNDFWQGFEKQAISRMAYNQAFRNAFANATEEWLKKAPKNLSAKERLGWAKQNAAGVMLNRVSSKAPKAGSLLDLLTSRGRKRIKARAKNMGVRMDAAKNMIESGDIPGMRVVKG